MERNRGLDLEKEEVEQDGSEHEFGATSPDCLYAVPVHLRRDNLPWGELQRGREDFMDCATRDPLNTLETKFNYAYRNNLFKPENKKWLEDKGYRVFHDGVPYIEFSDRFNAIKSGTRKTGNSMKAPRQSIHRDGLIPKQMLPPDSQMRWEDYHNANDITNEMEKLGKEFLMRWAINYDKYRLAQKAVLLERDLIGLAGYAWPRPIDGVYPRVENPSNHAFMAFDFPLTQIFDNYEEEKGDWIKQLAADYKFYPYGYRIYVREEMTPAEYKSLLQKAITFVTELLEGMMPPKSYDQDPRELPMNQPDDQKPVDLRQEILEKAKQALGTVVLTGKYPKEVSCADAMMTFLNRFLPIKYTPSTIEADRYFKTDDRFSRTLDLDEGNIIISPTEGERIGHCGIILEGGKIASNNSKTGLWDDHLTIDSWVARYRRELNLPVYVYKLKE